jgi:hypothetical protein
MFLDYFDVLMLIIIKKKNYFNAFQKKNTLKNSHYNILKHP